MSSPADGFSPVTRHVNRVAMPKPVSLAAPSAQRAQCRQAQAELRTLVFLFYQKGRDSRIFQAQDRAIDDFTRKGSTASWVGDHSQTTLWQIDKNLKSETGHGTQKPVECVRRPIENNSSLFRR
jgi:hypothetical protein